MTDTYRAERGMALLMTLFALLLMSALGMGLMFMANSETGINANFRTSRQAYYASRAGLEEGRDRLRQGSSSAVQPPTTMPSRNNPNGVIYLLNAAAGEVVEPWSNENKYFDNELCHENFRELGLNSVPPGIPCTQEVDGTYYTVPSPASTDPGTGTQAAIPYKWVRITMKQVASTAPFCADGNCAPLRQENSVCAIIGQPATFYEVPNPSSFRTCEQQNMPSVYQITSLAVTSNGSRRMTQYEVASLTFPRLPAALVFNGSIPLLVASLLHPLKINGYDNCGQTSAIPALGAYDDLAVTELSATVLLTSANYTGAGGTPSIQNVSSELGPLTTVGGLQTLAGSISANADQTFGNNPSISDLGSTSNPLVTVVNGDLTISGNTSGAGILLVTGTLTLQGAPSFNGVIFAIGKGEVQKTGVGNASLSGGLLLGNLYNILGTPLSPDSPPGIPRFVMTGGSATIQYDSCWMTRVSNRTIFRVLASREEIY